MSKGEQMDENRQLLLDTLHVMEERVKKGDIVSLGIAGGTADDGTTVMYMLPGGVSLAPLYLAAGRLMERMLAVGKGLELPTEGGEE